MRIPLKHYSGLLGNYLKPHWPKVFLLTALLLGGIGARTFNPQVLRYFIDAAKGNSDSSGFITSLLDFVGAIRIQPTPHGGAALYGSRDSESGHLCHSKIYR